MNVATILTVLILRRLRGLRYWTGLTDCQRGEFTAWVNHSFLICWDSLFWTLLYVYNLNPQWPINSKASFGLICNSQTHEMQPDQVQFMEFVQQPPLCSIAHYYLKCTGERGKCGSGCRRTWGSGFLGLSRQLRGEFFSHWGFPLNIWTLCPQNGLYNIRKYSKYIYSADSIWIESVEKIFVGE